MNPELMSQYDKAKNILLNYNNYPPEDVGWAYNIFGQIHLALKDAENSEMYFNHSITVYKSLYGTNNDKYLAVCGNLSSLYIQKQDYTKCIEFTIKIFKYKPENIEKYDYIYMSAYRNVGNSYRMIKEFRKASNYLTKCLIIAKNSRNIHKSFLGDIYYDLAIIFSESTKKTLAIDNYKLAIKHFKIRKDQHRQKLIFSYQNLAGLMAEVNRLDELSKILIEFLRIFHKDDLERVETYMNLVNLHLHFENYDKSISYLKKILKLTNNDQNGINIKHIQALYQLADIWDILSEIKKSNNAVNKSLLILQSDSIIHDDNEPISDDFRRELIQEGNSKLHS